MNCAPAACARSAGGVWFGFPGGDVPRVDEVPVLRLARPRHMVPDRAWGKEKEMKAYGDAVHSDEATRVGEAGWNGRRSIDLEANMLRETDTDGACP